MEYVTLCYKPYSALSRNGAPCIRVPPAAVSHKKLYATELGRWPVNEVSFVFHLQEEKN